MDPEWIGTVWVASRYPVLARRGISEDLETYSWAKKPTYTA